MAWRALRLPHGVLSRRRRDRRAAGRARRRARLSWSVRARARDGRRGARGARLSRVRRAEARDNSRRADFPLLAGNPELHYLDSAATSQKPRVVLDAMRDILRARQREPASRRVRAVGAGDRPLSRRARAHRALPRRRRRRLPDLHARHDRVAQPRRDGVGARERRARATRSSSPRWSTTRTSSRGSSSRSRAAREFRVCPLTGDGRVDLDALRALVGAAHEGRRVQSRLERARHDQSGRARSSRDRAQRPARSSCATARRARRTCRVDFDALGVDFYAFSGHKMCGPMGIGGLRRPPRDARGDAALSDRRRHDRVRARRATPRGTCCRTSSRRERRTSPTRWGSPRRATISTRSAWTRCARTSARWSRSPRERLAAIEGVRDLRPAAARAQRRGELHASADIHPHDLATILDERRRVHPRRPSLRAAADAAARTCRRRRARRSTSTATKRTSTRSSRRSSGRRGCSRADRLPGGGLARPSRSVFPHPHS